MSWDFPGGGYCCPECGEPFSPLSDHWSGEQLDWQVIVRLVAHCRRRYRRACSCRVPATVMAPGPPKAIGKGRFTNGFTAMLLAERFAAGRSMNSLVTGLSRQGAEISPATLAGTCARAGALLVPLADAIAERPGVTRHAEWARMGRQASGSAGMTGGACGAGVPGDKVGTTEWERPARLKFAA